MVLLVFTVSHGDPAHHTVNTTAMGCSITLFCGCSTVLFGPNWSLSLVLV